MYIPYLQARICLWETLNFERDPNNSVEWKITAEAPDLQWNAIYTEKRCEIAPYTSVNTSQKYFKASGEAKRLLSVSQHI